jgi:hypothetical protein
MGNFSTSRAMAKVTATKANDEQGGTPQGGGQEGYHLPKDLKKDLDLE